MAFRNGAYAKVWEISNEGKYSKARISTSKKNKETEQYETDFNGFVKLLGQAHNKGVQADDKIKIVSCEVQNKYDKEKKVTYWDCIIWEVETEETETAPKKDKLADLKPAEDVELPF